MQSMADQLLLDAPKTEAETLAKKAKQARRVKEVKDTDELDQAWPVLAKKLDALAADGHTHFFILKEAEPALFRTFSKDVGQVYLTTRGFTVHNQDGLLDVIWDTVLGGDTKR